MELLEKRIMQDGEVYPGNILKVSSFLNHQMDIDLLDEMGQEWARLFAGEGVNKILTIEASGNRHRLHCRPQFPLSRGICQKVQISEPWQGRIHCKG